MDAGLIDRLMNTCIVRRSCGHVALRVCDQDLLLSTSTTSPVLEFILGDLWLVRGGILYEPVGTPGSHFHKVCFIQVAELIDLYPTK